MRSSETETISRIPWLQPKYGATFGLGTSSPAPGLSCLWQGLWERHTYLPGTWMLNIYTWEEGLCAWDPSQGTSSWRREFFPSGFTLKKYYGKTSDEKCVQAMFGWPGVGWLVWPICCALPWLVTLLDLWVQLSHSLGGQTSNQRWQMDLFLLFLFQLHFKLLLSLSPTFIFHQYVCLLKSPFYY